MTASPHSLSAADITDELCDRAKEIAAEMAEGRTGSEAVRRVLSLGVILTGSALASAASAVQEGYLPETALESLCAAVSRALHEAIEEGRFRGAEPKGSA